MENLYDIIIIGGGAAGLTAAIYAGRANLKTLVLEKAAPGGQAAITDEVENYPGVENISGFELAQKMYAQAKKFGARFVTSSIKRIDLNGKIKVIETTKDSFEAKSVIIATGAAPKKAGFVGEEAYIGKGVSYCATCDGFFYKDKEVFVVGGGNSAVQEAIFLTKFAKSVTLLVRKDYLRCSKFLSEKLYSNEKIKVLFNTELIEVSGENKIQKLTLKNNVSGEKIYAQTEDKFGVFVFIGYAPETGIFESIEKDESGNIITDENMHTKVEGVFAAGDVRKKILRQIVTAAADGAIAAYEAEKYLENTEE